MANENIETSPNPRIDKRTTGKQFTELKSEKATYQLWNSFGREEENKILNKLAMPQGTLPLEPKDISRTKCLLGSGNFGKVSLAYNEQADSFYAIKKIKQQGNEPIDVIGCKREIDFGKILEKANVGEHFIYAADSVIALDKQNKQCLYEFMPKVATLGDGQNFKRLISYLENEKRETVLNHTALSLIEATGLLNKNRIFHRDLKANNVLFNNDGKAYISDFGSAICQSPRLIKEAGFAEGAVVAPKTFEVSKQVDSKYAGPAMYLGGTSQDLENWRLGLTLLQLCGVIKEPEENFIGNFNNLDILRLPKQLPGYILTDADEVNQIKDYYKKCVEKIKQESEDKIPVELRNIIYQLLEIEPQNRKISAEELEKLRNVVAAKRTSVQPIFNELTNFQIAQMTLQMIKRSLKKQIWSDFAVNNYSDPKDRKLQENKARRVLKEQMAALKTLIRDPNKNINDINSFIRSKIKNQNYLPVLTEHQLEFTIGAKRQKAITKLQNQTLRQAPPAQPNLEANQQNIGLPNNYTSQPSLEEEDHYASQASNNPTHYNPIGTNGASPQSEAATLQQLENQVKEAVNRLLAYYQNKMQGALRGFSRLQRYANLMLDRLFNYARRQTMAETELPYQPINRTDIDITAIKALCSRTESIIQQLTLSRVMEFNSSERQELYNRLLRDRESLKNIAQIDDLVDPNKLIEQIDKKLKLLSDFNLVKNTINNKITIKTEPGLLNIPPQKPKTYIVSNRANTVLTKFNVYNDQTITYELGSTPLHQHFVANNELKKLKTPNLYLYGPKEAVEKIAQKIYQLNKHKSKVNLYVNDELVKEKPTTKTFSTFFNSDKETAAQLSELKVMNLEEMSYTSPQYLGNH